MQVRVTPIKIVAVVALAMMNSLADPAAIGVATSAGHFKVDNNQVLRNATLFEGTQVESDAGAGELRLKGANVAFDTNTKTTVYKDRVVLDRGRIQWTGGPAFRAEAGPVRISGDSGSAKAIVQRKAGTVQVASLSGSVRVLSTTGALISTVAAGTAVELSQDAGAQGGNNQPNNNNGNNSTGLTNGTKAVIVASAVTAVVVPIAVVVNKDDKTVSP